MIDGNKRRVTITVGEDRRLPVEDDEDGKEAMYINKRPELLDFHPCSVQSGAIRCTREDSLTFETSRHFINSVYP